ncbi:unnamed protein product, partial [Ascophyllum nodosum]
KTRHRLRLPQKTRHGLCLRLPQKMRHRLAKAMSPLPRIPRWMSLLLLHLSLALPLLLPTLPMSLAPIFSLRSGKSTIGGTIVGLLRPSICSGGWVPSGKLWCCPQLPKTLDEAGEAPVTVQPFLDVFFRIFSQFVDGQMEDAYLALGAILDRLHDEDEPPST